MNGKVPQYAFPSTQEATFLGLTRRDYFAARAFQGFIAIGTPRSAAIEFAVAAADGLIEALDVMQS